MRGLVAAHLTLFAVEVSHVLHQRFHEIGNGLSIRVHGLLEESQLLQILAQRGCHH